MMLQSYAYTTVRCLSFVFSCRQQHALRDRFLHGPSPSHRQWVYELSREQRSGKIVTDTSPSGITALSSPITRQYLDNIHHIRPSDPLWR